ncbi:septal ring lytic transglycosylase RlpA family protein [Porticoccus sp. W117]|uniref:septal ring lytic transglycosylase RlpA family protein n=1 Tax=Porticoccus sp. W117 TaxID=3054777 RepID=UPI0025962C4C|nr:septal ring lytic transglycosylase RlpA family protein [Porticoccus sp. W117]MDM3871504.1 septal ring lytic transglycosylase RlpA family protein [Porticoccus sp. W117]
MLRNNRLFFPLLAAVLLLAGCGGSNYYKDDRPPRQDRDVSQIPDAVPRVEPITRAGNTNPYRALGKTYHLLPDNRGYKARGMASWYGSKFHGRPTANGETYDMFAMTAAHKTLKIPAYVKVTNLENNRQVVVRVNDRGPFLHDRLIDLSYAAAKKLNFADDGLAQVEVEYIDPAGVQARPEPVRPAQTGKPMEKGSYLQLAAFSKAKPALQMQARLRQWVGHPVLMTINEGSKGLLYKVLIGPVAQTEEQQRLKAQVRQREKLSPFLVQF